MLAVYWYIDGWVITTEEEFVKLFNEDPAFYKIKRFDNYWEARHFKLLLEAAKPAHNHYHKVYDEMMERKKAICDTDTEALLQQEGIP